ncbi:MAG: FmdB family zinc ribbon protein [Planctomycetota bacterium]
MPTYDYVCDGCSHSFELFQKVTDGVKRTCSECGEKKLRRLIGAGGGVIFKGSGFYETDYRSSEYKKRQKEESSGGSSSSSGSEKTSKGDGGGSKNSGEGKSGGGSSS